MPSTLEEMDGGRHFERVDWHPNRTRPPDLSAWPFTIPCVAQIIADGGFDLPAGVTFLVGENGSGKSTLIEALAASYPRHGHWASSGNSVGPDGSQEDSELRRSVTRGLDPVASGRGWLVAVGVLQH